MNILLALAGGYLLLVLLLFLLQRQMVFFPETTLHQTPDQYGLEWEDVRFETGDDVPLHGWYVPHPASKHVLLFSHGNAGNISHRLGFLKMLHEHGISTFIYDYRGYGKSGGRPSERGIYRDVEAAWNYLVDQKGYRPGQIVLFGRSLGGAVSAHLAQHTEPAGLILDSSFISAREMASDVYPFIPSSLVRFKFATMNYLQKTRAPVLIMHSSEDRIVRYRHGEELFRAAPGQRMFVELSGGHNNNYLVSTERYFGSLNQFLSGL